MNQPPEPGNIPRIYTAQALEEGQQLALEAGPSRHLAAALRLQQGARVIVFNGAGGEFLASITDATRKQVCLQVESFDPQERESSLHVELGIAVSRGDRMDLAIQKSTELGVSLISPLLTERTEVKLKAERLQKKLQHWQQVAISACEQCGRTRVPEIRPLCRLSEWLPTVEAEQKLVLHHRSTGKLVGSASSAAVLVGPEGGLTATEIDAAQTLGFKALTLGPRVLRTETAPLAALAILQHQWGDLS